MPGRLDKNEVQAWLKGQKAAARVVERERVQFLLSLTPDRSLALYLKLKENAPLSVEAKPSPLLWSMRQALTRKFRGE